MKETEKKSLAYYEKVQQKAERKRKRQGLLKNKYYESTWNRFLMENDSNESESSSTGKRMEDRSYI